jgi:dihydrofolate reductase
MVRIPRATTAWVRFINRSTPSCGAGRRATWRSTFKKKGIAGSAFDTRVKNYVFTHRPPQSAAPAGVEFVNEPIKAFATRLREKKGKDIWMMGGAGIIGHFSTKEKIDEFMIHVIPKLIGEGIPLIAPRRRTVPLKLIASTKFPDGAVKLHYAISK